MFSGPGAPVLPPPPPHTQMPIDPHLPPHHPQGIISCVKVLVHSFTHYIIYHAFD